MASSHTQQCVTRISDKHPQMSLRGDFQSLGIELIYNSQRVGVKVANDESKSRRSKLNKEKQRKQLWINQQLKTNLAGGVGPNSMKSVSNSLNKATRNFQTAHRKIYSSPTNLETECLLSPIKNYDRTRHSGKSEILKKGVEKLSLNEAFRVPSVSPIADLHLPFESRESPRTPSELSRRFSSIISKQDRGVGSLVRDPPVTSPTVASGRLLEHSSNSEIMALDSIISIDAPGLKVEKSRRKKSFRIDPSPRKSLFLPTLGQACGNPGPTFSITNVTQNHERRKTGIGKNGSIKVKLHKSKSQVTEFFDLTDLSEEDNELCNDYNSTGDNISTLPSMKNQVSQNEVQPISIQLLKEDLPDPKLQIPAHKDNFGKTVLDLSYVEERDGPGSPLVFSPRETGHSDCRGGMGNPKASLLLGNKSYELHSHDFGGSNTLLPRTSVVMERDGVQDDTSEDTFMIYNSPRNGTSSKRIEEITGPWPFLHGNVPKMRPLLTKIRSNPDQRLDLYGDKSGSSLGEEIVSNKLPKQKERKNLSTAFGLSLSDDVEEMPRKDLEVAKRETSIGTRSMLHEVCSRDLPDRFNHDPHSQVEGLVGDIVKVRVLLTSLYNANPDACTSLDRSGDLPVHLLARRLMEWEARWYQNVYEKAQGEHNDEHKGTNITTLYQTMSQCIDLLLKPLSQAKNLCRTGGSVGILLPCHIAAIFTVSYDTLKSLLEHYPSAAAIPCDLNGIQTFIPSQSIPLELHNRLSTDFPKWEFDTCLLKSETKLTWAQSMLDDFYGTEGRMRRSDLMFAFYPHVSPYCHDTKRFQRIEERICQEVNWCELSLPIKSLLICLCTFRSQDDNYGDYSDSIERVVGMLSFQAIRCLASIPLGNGEVLLDEAEPKCRRIILRRLEEIANNDIPILAGTSTISSSKCLRGWEAEISSRFSLGGRGLVAVLLHSLFNVREERFPTSFVLLPYRLIKERNGKLGLESRDAATVAMKFADCLLHLTSPKAISFFLQKKTKRFLGKKFKVEDILEKEKIEMETKEATKCLLSLYQKGPAYFYFIDESTGTPVIPEHQEPYPLMLGDSFDIVRKVLPLMLSGMILMRGEKAYRIIAGVLLNQSSQLMQPNWVDAAKDLVGYLYSPKTEWTQTLLQDLFPLRESILNRLQEVDSGNCQAIEKNFPPSNEWVVELSLVKKVVTMYDPHRNYSGLKSKRAGKQILWTRHTEFFDERLCAFFPIEFLTVSEVKKRFRQERGTTNDIRVDDVGRSKPTVGNVSGSSSNYGLDVLFGEFSFGANKRQKVPSNTGKINDELTRQSWSREKHRHLSKIQKPKTRAAVISVLNFDDNVGLDEVSKQKILLDEQEAKLEFLREKISDIQEAELDLLKQEERISGMMNESQTEGGDLIKSPTNQGLFKARSLLIRLSELENRILCKEVEGTFYDEEECYEEANGDNSTLD